MTPRPADGGPARRLRIVLPALFYHPERPSGSSRLAYDEARYLAEAGHDTWLVAMDGGSGCPEHVQDGALHVLRYRRPRLAALDPTGRHHQRAVRRVLLRHVGDHADVVHGHMLHPMAAALDLYGATARCCYSLHSLVAAELRAERRGASPARRLRLSAAAIVRDRLEAKVIARSDIVTSDSRYTRDLAADVHGRAAADKVRVVPGWVDLARFRVIGDRVAAKRELGWPDDRPVLFSVRRFVPRMGLDALVDAAARLRAAGRDFLLVIGGDGPLRPALVARAAQLRLGESVRLPGRIPDHLLPVMYGAADAFVLPSAELECFGLIALEALACGRPVLATPVAAIPELLGGLEPAWLSETADADGLSALIGDYLGGRLPSRDPLALRAFVERSYSADRVIAELAELATGLPSPSVSRGI
jgi:glycosyltransferase involved in cell wall biosynthesis